jgi:hypothetical protein
LSAFFLRGRQIKASFDHEAKSFCFVRFRVFRGQNVFSMRPPASLQCTLLSRFVSVCYWNSLCSFDFQPCPEQKFPYGYANFRKPFLHQQARRVKYVHTIDFRDDIPDSVGRHRFPHQHHRNVTSSYAFRGAASAAHRRFELQIHQDGAGMLRDMFQRIGVDCKHAAPPEKSDYESYQDLMLYFWSFRNNVVRCIPRAADASCRLPPYCFMIWMRSSFSNLSTAFL